MFYLHYHVSVIEPLIHGFLPNYFGWDVRSGARCDPWLRYDPAAQLYAEHCNRCHGADGNGVATVDLRGGKFPSATTDLQLKLVIFNGLPTSGMPPFRFDNADFAGLIAYLRNMNSVDPGSLKWGNAAGGQVVVETKGACLTCHRINDKGSRKAPDLSNIGANRSAGSIERSLVDPSGQMWPINRPVRIVTRNGRVINGRRLNEDTYTVQVADEEGRLISLDKADLEEFVVSPTSTMPSYKQALTSGELADVVTYLLSLKGQ